MNGKATIWNKNGNKSTEAHYRNGTYYGKWTMWHKNGQKRSEGNAVGGTNRRDMVKNGKWTMWDENGKKVSERTHNYSRGVL